MRLPAASTQQKQELDLQEIPFWNAPSRPLNHFAQSIYRNTGDIPTFGTASDGNHLSTDFGRALEEVFEFLGINSRVRNPAVWALDQMKSGAALPKMNALAKFFLQASPEPIFVSN